MGCDPLQPCRHLSTSFFNTALSDNNVPPNTTLKKTIGNFIVVKNAKFYISLSLLQRMAVTVRPGQGESLRVCDEKRNYPLHCRTAQCCTFGISPRIKRLQRLEKHRSFWGIQMLV